MLRLHHPLFLALVIAFLVERGRIQHPQLKLFQENPPLDRTINYVIVLYFSLRKTVTVGRMEIQVLGIRVWIQLIP